MLDKCKRGNEIAPLWHKCQAKWGMCAKGVQFYCPSSTYLAIVLLVLYFIAFNYRAIFDTNAERSEACMLKGCIKNWSTVKLYNKVLIITSISNIFRFVRKIKPPWISACSATFLNKLHYFRSSEQHYVRTLLSPAKMAVELFLGSYGQTPRPENSLATCEFK